MSYKLSVEQQNIIVEWKHLADSIAARRKRTKLRQIGSVSLDDLQSIAYSGLIDAAKKYDSSKGQFRSYAILRINGHITDYIRSLIGRETTKKKKPKMVSLECPLPFHLNDYTVGTIEDTLTANLYEKEDERRAAILFLTATKCLAGPVRKIAMYYFHRNFTMREVAEIFQMPEVHVSMLIRYAVEKMKLYWCKNNTEDLFIEL